MNIQTLSYFIQVADAKSYSIAAKKNYIAQSSLSTTIKRLEEELSFKLFNYDGKTLHLTTEGEQLYKLATEFLSSYEIFFDSAINISEDVTGTISLLLPVLISEIFFSKPIAAFKQKYPNVTFNIANRGGYAAQNLVFINEYDLAVVIHPVIPNVFECFDFISRPFVLAVSESHHLADREYVTYEELAMEEFVSYEEDSVLYQRFINKTADAGYAPNILVKAAETPFLLSLVENKVGILVVPECVIDYRVHNNLKFIPIKGEENGYQLVMIYKKDKYLSTACLTFINFIKDWYANDKMQSGNMSREKNK